MDMTCYEDPISQYPISKISISILKIEKSEKDRAKDSPIDIIKERNLLLTSQTNLNFYCCFCQKSICIFYPLAFIIAHGEEVR